MLTSLVPGVGMGGGNDGSVPVSPTQPPLYLKAGRTKYVLRAGRQVIAAKAGRWTFNIRASRPLSITSNIVIFRGEDRVINFQMTPVEDVTGWTITWKLASSLAGSVQVTKTATIVDGPRGKFKVTLASADTSGLTPGRFVWDCRRTDSGSRETLADGYLDLKQEVTA